MHARYVYVVFVLLLGVSVDVHVTTQANNRPLTIGASLVVNQISSLIHKARSDSGSFSKIP